MRSVVVGILGLLPQGLEMNPTCQAQIYVVYISHLVKKEIGEDCDFLEPRDVPSLLQLLPQTS